MSKQFLNCSGTALVFNYIQLKSGKRHWVALKKNKVTGLFIISVHIDC